MSEVQTGVFVGKLSGLVRDLLWQKCVDRSAGGRCCQAYSANNEQGLGLRVAGDLGRSVVDLDGILLVATRNARWAAIRDGQESAL
ncbi:MAG: type I-E CRISPR-associated endoribonuclease Cas2 [Candidatus Bipolaricaulota bacterium]